MKMKKITVYLLAAFAAALMLALPASAQRQYENCFLNIGLYDRCDTIDNDFEAAVSEQIRKTSDKIDMYVAVIFCGDETGLSNDHAVETFADNCYDALFNPQYGVDTDGVLLVVNYVNNYAYITTSGMGQLYFTNGNPDRISEMISKMGPYLRDRQSAEAVSVFCVELERYYSKGVPQNCFTYDKQLGLYYYESHGKLVSSEHLPWWFGVNFTVIGAAALLIGGLAALISVLIVRSRYKLVKSLEPANYISRNETGFSVKQDLFLRKHTSRVRIDSDSRSGGGGGGGGSSHMSSGGHSHGGGGGHF